VAEWLRSFDIWQET